MSKTRPADSHKAWLSRVAPVRDHRAEAAETPRYPLFSHRSAEGRERDRQATLGTTGAIGRLATGR